MLTLTQYQYHSQERLLVIVDLKRCYRIILNEWMNRHLTISTLCGFIVSSAVCNQQTIPALKKQVVKIRRPSLPESVRELEEEFHWSDWLHQGNWQPAIVLYCRHRRTLAPL